jgi:hypothetical protein
MTNLTGAKTFSEFCKTNRICRETGYKQVRSGKLRVVKVGRKSLVLLSDELAWQASLPVLPSRLSESAPDLKTTGSEQAPKLEARGPKQASA